MTPRFVQYRCSYFQRAVDIVRKIVEWNDVVDAMDQQSLGYYLALLIISYENLLAV